MSWFGSDSREAQASQQVQEAELPEHKAALSHELIAAAASYEAAKAYEKHCAENNGGKPEPHAKAKELLAGFAGAFIDRMVETKGLDTIDKEKAKYEAKKKHDADIESYPSEF
ncbi:putative phosphoglycerate mutase family protein [Mycena vitilis]|nr:putative phosphoglycerate mutase family protein [Mycena vitilis]